MKETPSFPNVKIKGNYLHSPYNPIREADRIIDRGDYGDKTVFILFEPGLGYAAERLLERTPRGKILIISPLDLLSPALKGDKRISYWTGDLDSGLKKFLAEHIHESDIDSLAYVPWPPAVRLLPEEASLAGRQISSVIKILQANHSHVKGFGKAYFRNTVINYLSSPSPRIPAVTGRPVLISASGPSLQENMGELEKHHREYFHIALPSAVRALLGSGIRPHMILSTDPGYWASRHFRHFPPDIPVGISLNGRTDNRKRAYSYPVINQQTFLEKALLENWHLPRVNTTGSVALTALELSLALDASSITFAGFDLCMKDIKSHTSPHSFDNFLLSGTGRFSSILQVHFERAASMTSYREGSLRFGFALEQYRTWFRGRDFPIPLYRLSGHTPPVEGLEEITALKRRQPLKEKWVELAIPPLPQRREKLKSVIRTWTESSEEHFNNPDLFLSPDTDDLKDFLYTLASEELSLLKKELILGRDINRSRRAAEDKIKTQFREMEVLVERFSIG